MERAAASASTSASDVRLLVFDFDLTILSIHSWGERIRPEDVASRSLDRDVADLAFFRRFIARALDTGVKVAIASFGVYEVIQAYMDLAVGPGVFTRENISTPSQHGTRDGHVVPGGKVPQLEALTAKLLGCVSPADVSAAAASVVFFDDSRENVAGAIRRGFVRSVLIDERCFTRGAWEDAKERVGMERFIA